MAMVYRSASPRGAAHRMLHGGAGSQIINALRSGPKGPNGD